MYIIRNAWISIIRSLPRNYIVGIIVFVISTASCIALSIQQSADVARLRNMQSLDIEARINVDRQYIMQEMKDSDLSDKTAMADTLSDLSGLSLDEMQTYAKADCVEDFYYYSTISLNGDNDLKALSENEYTALNDLLEGNNAPSGRPGSNAPPSMQEIMASITFQGDFMLYGYVSDRAMTEFQDSERKIVSGAMFNENTQDYVCVISDDLATYNSLSVGDQITLTNPNLGSQRFVFTIIGLYKDSTDNTTTAVDAANDPANIILTSYYVVNDIAERSKDYNDPASVTSFEKMDNGLMAERLLTVSGSVVCPAASEDEESESATDTTETDEEEQSTAITASTTGIYLFKDIAGYDLFEQAVRDLGLENKYTVISNDVATYEASLVPLENLKSFATTFLYVILGIGAIVLIALNTFNIRERKYEIGVLTAIGMAKPKVAAQFAVELLIVTFMAIFLGLFSGALASVPITNSLLASQVKQEESQSQQQNENFGREVSAEVSKPKGGDVEGKVEYVSAVTFSTDYVVISKMALIGVLLTAVSGLVTSLFIMRYDPLKILTERD